MDAFNLACDYVAWHNFGTEWFVIIGRDFGFFIIGYIACMIIGAIVESIKEVKNGRNKKNR